HDCPGSLVAQVQVPAFHQEVDSVFLWRYGVVGRGVQQFQGAALEFDAAGAALVAAYRALHDQAAFLAECPGPCPGVVVDVAAHEDSLDEAGSVPELQERDLAAGADSGEPAAEFYGATGQVWQLRDGRFLHTLR